MPNTPLQPFSPPAFLSSLPVSGNTFMPLLVYGALFIWIIYTVVAIYHWYRYSHASWVAFPAVALHLFVSLTLIGYILASQYISP